MNVPSDKRISKWVNKGRRKREFGLMVTERKGREGNHCIGTSEIVDIFIRLAESEINKPLSMNSILEGQECASLCLQKLIL